MDAAGGMMFSGCPSVCACVRTSVHPVESFPTDLPSTSGFYYALNSDVRINYSMFDY